MGIILWTIWAVAVLLNFPQAADAFGYETVSWWWHVGAAVATMMFNFLTAALLAIVGTIVFASRW